MLREINYYFSNKCAALVDTVQDASFWEGRSTRHVELITILRVTSASSGPLTPRAYHNPLSLKRETSSEVSLLTGIASLGLAP